MQSRNHLVIFIGILILGALVWAGISFWTNKTARPDASYGVVQTVQTKPSSPELVAAYYTSLMGAAADLTSADTCRDAAAQTDAFLGSVRVPKEFLDNHLNAFLFVKKQLREQADDCLDMIGTTLSDLAQTVTSTAL